MVDVLLLLTNGTHVLLALREGTGVFDGQRNVPSGKVEPDEHVFDAMCREAREEIGLTLTPDELRLATVLHVHYPGHPTRLGLFFHVPHRPEQHGQPVNAEPHKCAEIGWYRFDELPSNTVPYTATGVRAYREGRPLALEGW